MKNNKLQLNDIKIEEKIGDGSYGHIYKIQYIKTSEYFALKRINKRKLKENPGYTDYLFQALYKELECMKKCECENSIKLYGNFQTENNFNIMMELCDSDLAHYLSEKNEGLTSDEIKELFNQLNNAFKKMNANNIIHRDLKLSNILIKHSDSDHKKIIPKLSDYGFSKELKEHSASTRVGTLDTMAPEVVRCEEYNEKADLWSVGVMIYQLYFKELPYKFKVIDIIQ